MKKLLVLIVALALIASVSATSGVFNDGWATCNAAGGYGGWDKDPNTCRVAWDGVTQACTDANRDATFTVGLDAMTTTNINVVHLNGISDTDGFEIWGDTLLCTVPDVATDTETWVSTDCPVNLQGVKTLTLHPTAITPWSDCNTWGQVAIQNISFAAESQVPEFGLIAGGTALIGALGIFVFAFKRK